MKIFAAIVTLGLTVATCICGNEALPVNVSGRIMFKEHRPKLVLTVENRGSESCRVSNELLIESVSPSVDSHGRKFAPGLEHKVDAEIDPAILRLKLTVLLREQLYLFGYNGAVPQEVITEVPPKSKKQVEIDLPESVLDKLKEREVSAKVSFLYSGEEVFVLDLKWPVE